jgi:hypothetical protein
MSMNPENKKQYTVSVLDLVETCMGLIAKYPDRSIEVIEHMTKRIDQLESEYIVVEKQS